VATLYAPLRKRLEALVDRRFKFDERRFGAYRNEVRQVLSVLEPTRAAQRLAAEAVAELQALAGAVVDADGRPTASAGTWPVQPVIRMSILGGRQSMAMLVVGPRADGRRHDPTAVADLQEVVALVAAAVRLHGPVRTASGDPAPTADVDR